MVYFDKAHWFDSSFKIKARNWNTLCRYGGLYQQVNLVLGFCELTVQMEPNWSGYRENRGLVRALVGDFQGAIEDFQFAIERTQNEENKTRWQGWLEHLQAGENPFIPEILEKLRP